MTTDFQTNVPRRKQHYMFAHKLLPSILSNEPANFIGTLEKGGNDFLYYLWDRLGSYLKESDLVAREGLDCQINQLDDDTTIALVTLPPPQKLTEAYFVAAVYRPPMTRFITLEYADQTPERIRTFLCEWKGNYHSNLGNGPEPTLGAFFETVVKLIK
jgi:hypothetical protein